MTFIPVDIFQQIIDKETPANILYEDESSIAFSDIDPKAKFHALIVPKQKFITAQEVTPENTKVFGELFLAAKKVAETEGLTGYKLYMNVGESAGQVVPRVHLHLLSSDYKSNL